ncbi:MAG: ABC transporter ATP-binding protein [Thermoleophilia bacterium]|nr:ABC transporter ATP-binding protein [Thermoleophilia bacterium]
MNVILEVKGLTKRFGGLTAVKDLDMEVGDQEIFGLIGPNGAGKSTVFSMISGFQKPTSGEILFQGSSLAGASAHSIARRGVARLFQHSVLFDNISALENVIVGFHRTRTVGLMGSFVYSRKVREEEAGFKARALEILEFVGLVHLKDELAANLSHGHQRMLSVGITLATSPSLLLLDEPVTGMNPTESKAMVQIIRKIREQGITIMLVEHHMRVVTDVCDRIVVLNYGEKIAEGDATTVCNDPEVCAAYLGKGTFDAA